MYTTKTIKALLVFILSIFLLGCGGEEDESKKLGFRNVDEMKMIHARGWHTKAQYDSDLREAKEQAAMGDKFFDGNGVEKNYAEAFQWYLKSAENGWTLSKFQVAFMYEQGKGVQQDNAKAIFWFKSAAADGHEMSKVELKRITGQ